MPRRYNEHGERLWNGKTAAEFRVADVQAFLNDTEQILNKNKEEPAMSKEPVKPEPAADTAGLPMKLDVTARPIEPKGNLVGFASLKINDCFVVNDFKILQSEKGLFVGMPSKPDQSSRTGYRDTAMPITKEFRTQLTKTVTEAYHKEVEKLQARAAAIATPETESIGKQLEAGKEQAAKNKSSRPAPTRGKAKNAER